MNTETPLAFMNLPSDTTIPQIDGASALKLFLRSSGGCKIWGAGPCSPANAAVEISMTGSMATFWMLNADWKYFEAALDQMAATYQKRTNHTP